MIITTVEDCFKFRLLRKISPDKDKVKRSLEVAEIKLKEVPEAIKLGFHSYGILDAYMCMFHAARALLYNDGIQEKSHYAIYIYLKERYSQKIPLSVLNLLNIHRTQRHEAMYGLEFRPDEADATTAYEDAQRFLNEVKKVLK